MYSKDPSCVGNLRTSDNGGPYNISLLTVQANEIKGKFLIVPHQSCNVTSVVATVLWSHTVLSCSKL